MMFVVIKSRSEMPRSVCPQVSTKARPGRKPAAIPTRYRVALRGVFRRRSGASGAPVPDPSNVAVKNRRICDLFRARRPCHVYTLPFACPSLSNKAVRVPHVFSKTPPRGLLITSSFFLDASLDDFTFVHHIVAFPVRMCSFALAIGANPCICLGNHSAK